jgi:hypothetical protein
MAIPLSVESKLSDAVWARSRDSEIANALAELGVSPESEFAAFYSRYWGPFRSNRTGVELLDIVEQEESVLTNTRTVREEYGFPNQFIVVSSLNAGSVVVFETTTGNVYDVDFEGGDALLVEGKLAPSNNSWNDFLSQYFG